MIFNGESLQKEIETLKKGHLEFKSTIYEIKNSMDNLSIRLDTVENMISEIKEKSINIIQTEPQRIKRRRVLKTRSVSDICRPLSV